MPTVNPGRWPESRRLICVSLTMLAPGHLPGGDPDSRATLHERHRAERGGEHTIDQEPDAQVCIGRDDELKRKHGPRSIRLRG
jgi:hypothetical protein